MPLDEDYGPQIYSSNADLQNVRLYLLSLMSNSPLHILLAYPFPSISY